MGGESPGLLERGHSVAVAPSCPRNKDVPGAIFLFIGCVPEEEIKGCGGTEPDALGRVPVSSSAPLGHLCARGQKPSSSATSSNYPGQPGLLKTTTVVT